MSWLDSGKKKKTCTLNTCFDFSLGVAGCLGKTSFEGTTWLNPVFLDGTCSSPISPTFHLHFARLDSKLSIDGVDCGVQKKKRSLEKLPLGSFQQPAMFCCSCFFMFFLMFFCMFYVFPNVHFLYQNHHRSHVCMFFYIQWNVNTLCGLCFKLWDFQNSSRGCTNNSQIDWLRCPTASTFLWVFLSLTKTPLQPCNESNTVINQLLFLQDSLFSGNSSCMCFGCFGKYAVHDLFV